MPTDGPDGLITGVPDATVRRSDLFAEAPVEFTVRRERVLPPPPPPRHCAEPAPPMPTHFERAEPEEPAGSPVDGPPGPEERNSRRRLLVWLSVAATVIAAGTVALIVSRSSGNAPAAQPVAPPPPENRQSALPAAPLKPVFAVACVGTSCRFTLDDPARFGGAGLHWTFGDGGVRAGPATISHRYRTTGSYTASLAVDLPGGAAHSAAMTVRLTSWHRAVRLRAGPAGSRQLTAAVSAPVGCRTGAYQLHRIGAGGRVVAQGSLPNGSLRLKVPAAGRYRLVLPPVPRAGGICAAATSAPTTVKAAPPVRRSGTSAPPVTTQRQPPTHYTPPAPR